MQHDKTSTDWKDFLLRHKWMPTKQLVSRFGLEKHDVDNFRRWPNVRAVLEPWRVSLQQSPVRLQNILSDGWKYYLESIREISLSDAPSDWVPQILGLKNISRDSGFTFLTDSRYLELVCPTEYREYREKGFTNIALGLFQFWPGKEFLRNAGVLPYMFLQTHSRAMQQLDAESIVEHVYLAFFTGSKGIPTKDALTAAKERFYARHQEQGFLTTRELDRFGVPYSFYKDSDGIQSVKEHIARRYGVELGYEKSPDTSWSSSKFRLMFPEVLYDTCAYCKLVPSICITFFRAKTILN